MAAGDRDIFCEPFTLMRLRRNLTFIAYATGNRDTFGASLIERAVMLSAIHHRLGDHNVNEVVCKMNSRMVERSGNGFKSNLRKRGRRIWSDGRRDLNCRSRKSQIGRELQGPEPIPSLSVSPLAQSN